MRLAITILTFIMLTVLRSAWAQEKFTKKELYAVWMAAEEKLDEGQFNEALSLYKAYPKDSSFMLRSRQTRLLVDLAAEGDRLLKRNQSAEALDKFKEYRKFKDIGSLHFFEEKIETCLQNINKEKLTELTSQQRIITGFEFAHRGRQKLSRLDTAGAKKDFNNAKALGGNRNNILKEQYVDGLRTTEDVSNWGKRNLGAAADSRSTEEKLKGLESYREIHNVNLPGVEDEIKLLRANLRGDASLADIAGMCDIDLLVKQVEANKSRINSSEYFLSRLKELQSTRQKIAALKQSSVHVETVRSAYTTLFSWVDELPTEVRQAVKTCVEKEYAAYSAQHPVTPSQNSQKCEGEDSFRQTLSLIRKELSNCNLNRSKALWGQAVTYIRSCENSAFLLKANASLLDSISRFTKNDSLLVKYRVSVKEFANARDCQKLREVYEKMQSLKPCDVVGLERELGDALVMVNNCKADSWFKAQLVGGFYGVRPHYKIGDAERDMAMGWMATAGVELTYIDHKNIAEFVAGVHYFRTNYYSNGAFGSTNEDFTIQGVTGSLGIKLHLPNTRPESIRPYLKFGPEVHIPVSYTYRNYSTSATTDGVDQLQKTVLSIYGGLGMEIQKKQFGAFVEVLAAPGLGNIYNSGVSHLSTAKEKVEASLTRFGIKLGLRLW
ncbi:hypothetical protein SAMN05216327_1207 [Dyadobacter sp. SG02]|uniref:hypothetical protein n=1 Tax=Dyadobacter sp. SG02 TaxID=1855291 RepID=UPI0008B8591F|nr:hypothetical protein [Dyadobacter sp. SG02]SEJ78830.1 hypothetical protein SAMN05216327_1207 [Dyadobacter sp. SG02]